MDKNKINFKGVGQPLRIALTGSKFGPGIYYIILSLDKNEVIKNRKEAIIKAIEMSKNHIIVILGKGIEEYQILKNKKIPHSDINTVENYINENRN